MLSEKDISTLAAINERLLENHPNLDDIDLKFLALQEDLLLIDDITNDEYLAIGLALVEAVKSLGRKDRKPVVIDIEVNGLCIVHHAMSGTSRDNEWWIERKKRTVKHFGKSSYQIGRSLNLAGTSWTEKYAGLEEGLYAAHGGCFPLRTGSQQMIGTITMSGLAQVLDHITITKVLADYLSKKTKA